MKINLPALFLTIVIASQPTPASAQATVDLESASSFAILAGSGITFSTPGTSITGDIGSYSTPAITGTFSFVTGTNHDGDAFTQAAKTALAAAYADAATRTATTIGTELGGTTLGAGVYSSAAGTFGITGNLTLNGDVDDIFIFKMASTLTTAVSSNVLLTGGAQANNIFWQVGSSATLGGTSVFAGNILALTSITLGAGSTVDGRLLAQAGHVTLGGGNTITASAIPEPAATAVLIAASLGLVLGARRIRRHISARRSGRGPQTPGLGKVRSAPVTGCGVQATCPPVPSAR